MTLAEDIFSFENNENILIIFKIVTLVMSGWSNKGCYWWTVVLYRKDQLRLSDRTSMAKHWLSWFSSVPASKYRAGHKHCLTRSRCSPGTMSIRILSSKAVTCRGNWTLISCWGHIVSGISQQKLKKNVDTLILGVYIYIHDNVSYMREKYKENILLYFVLKQPEKML